MLADDGISERSCGWIDAGWQLSLFCPFWAERSKRGAREEGRKSGFAGGKIKREKRKQKPLEVRAKERKSDFTGVEVLSTGNGVGKSINKGENLVFAVSG